MKNFFVGFSVILVVIVGVLLFNTLTFYSLQQEVEPVTDNPVYRKRAIDKLAGAVNIPTVSYQNTSKIDYAAFRLFTSYLEQQFPLIKQLIHGRWHRLTVNRFGCCTVVSARYTRRQLWLPD